MSVSTFVLVISLMLGGQSLSYGSSEHNTLAECLAATALIDDDEVVQITRDGAQTRWACLMCTPDGCTVVANDRAEVVS